MTLRRDHVAGGAFVLIGLAVFAMSGDLPFGTFASPGAGMMPMLVLGLMIAFGLALVARAGTSPPLADIHWTDLSHALIVACAAAAAIAVYTVVGFLPSMAVMLFALMWGIERRPLVASLAVSLGVTFGAYVLFGTLLKSPLPPTPFGF